MSNRLSSITGHCFGGDSKYGLDPTGIADSTVGLQALLDDCFGPVSAPHGTLGKHLNRVCVLPPGKFKTKAPLQVKYLHGGTIVGAGRGATIIENVTGGEDQGAVFRTNGMGYSYIGGLYLHAHAGGICLDFDWDSSAGGAALQANTIEDVFAYGSSEAGTVGARIGQTGFMGSEFIFKNFHTQECKLAGTIINNFNALQHQFYGGQDQSCGVGIWVTVGSAPIISGRGFQLQSVCDIKTSGGVHNAMVVSGCRTESPNFIFNEGGQSLDISGCIQTTGNGLPGKFLKSAGGIVNMRSCEFDGKVSPYYGCLLSATGLAVYGTNWLALDPSQLWWQPNNPIAASIHLRHINIYTGGPLYTQIDNQRRFTADGRTITTVNY